MARRSRYAVGQHFTRYNLLRSLAKLLQLVQKDFSFWAYTLFGLKSVFAKHFPKNAKKRIFFICTFFIIHLFLFGFGGGGLENPHHIDIKMLDVKGIEQSTMYL